MCLFFGVNIFLLGISIWFPWGFFLLLFGQNKFNCYGFIPDITETSKIKVHGIPLKHQFVSHCAYANLSFTVGFAIL